MINVFQLNYDARLRSWYELRLKINELDIREKCFLIDEFWQQVPLVNYHLHVLDTKIWPDPWELLAENTYCTIAKALGMCYTLLLVGVNDIKMVEATDMHGEDVVLVLVDSAKYVLNYWPNTVVNNCSKDFTIKRQVDISHIQQKL